MMIMINLRRGLILMQSILFFISSSAQIANRFDLVIDEFMADPSPPVGLPNSEYIELKNVSSTAFNLRNWKISVGNGLATVNSNYILLPDSFVVICPSSSVIALSKFGAAIGASNFPAINNEGEVISILSPEGRIIHAVDYRIAWYDNALKSEGGWSLEMIDTKNPCAGGSNWKPSIDPRGGSPGLKNSVNGSNPDKQSPVLKSSYAIDAQTIVAVFDEPLDSLQAVVHASYTLDHGMTSPFAVIPIAPLFNEVQLRFTTAMKADVIYQLRVSGVADCAGNIIGSFNQTRCGLPLEADTMDLVINELLFNPKPDGTDYVELLNRSRKTINAANLHLATRNSTGQIISIKKISEQPFPVFPGDHFTITANSSLVSKKYFVKNPQWLMPSRSLPSLPDDEGVIMVLNKQGKIIDELQYDERWHFPLLSTHEGVSLERIDPEMPTQSPENWTSSAAVNGYGTPTYENAQLRKAAESTGIIAVSPKIFSPDNDGMDDVCYINYALDAPNYVASVRIFDVSGRVVRNLYSNITLAQKSYLKWDGLDDRSAKLPVGIYIVLVEVFNLQGKTGKFKNTVVLAQKF